MSFAPVPPTLLTTAPTATDDASKGFYTGMLVVDTTVTPPVLYACASSTVGQAKWAPVGMLIRMIGTPMGAATILNFDASTVSVTNGVATVTPFGGWRNHRAFSAHEGQTYFPISDVPSSPASHQVYANGMLLRLGENYDYTVDATGITVRISLEAGNPLLVYY